MVKIKLCGFTREEDIEKAVEFGVDYVGIILYEKSPRYVSWERLKDLLSVATGVKRVAVMVNPTSEEVLRAFEVGFDLLQLHGEESLEFAKAIGLDRVIKAFRTCPGLEVSKEWKSAYGVLLDACSKLYGGSGQESDWELAKGLVEEGFKVFLAGGLRPENVKEAIRSVRPYAVDVSSGIELSPGIKDHKKMEEFVNAVKNAFKD
ncbi:MAG: phosphoribosylanthranilate isomerase [Aquificota bacterium]|jgi:phosphoribosylanthranilate isomerase|nr:phosphoribosylanthranilate isomerase [Aquificaceae bacterium]